MIECYTDEEIKKQRQEYIDALWDEKRICHAEFFILTEKNEFLRLRLDDQLIRLNVYDNSSRIIYLSEVKLKEYMSRYFKDRILSTYSVEYAFVVSNKERYVNLDYWTKVLNNENNIVSSNWTFMYDKYFERIRE